MINTKNKQLEYFDYSDQIKVNIKYNIDDQGLIHHPSLPAIVIKQSNGEKFEYFFSHGFLFREENQAKPSYIYSCKSKILEQRWTEKTLQEEAPLISEEFLIKNMNHHNFFRILLNSLLHNLSDNAMEIYNANEQKILSYWYKNGDLHRDDGPAIITGRDKDKSEQFFLEGNEIKLAN